MIPWWSSHPCNHTQEIKTWHLRKLQIIETTATKLAIGVTYSYVTNIIEENYLGYLLINSYQLKKSVVFNLRLAIARKWPVQKEYNEFPSLYILTKISNQWIKARKK